LRVEGLGGESAWPEGCSRWSELMTGQAAVFVASAPVVLSSAEGNQWVHFAVVTAPLAALALSHVLSPCPFLCPPPPTQHIGRVL
jgi:hypothetical protein